MDRMSVFRAFGPAISGKKNEDIPAELFNQSNLLKLK
jgi:hypothetical protein